MLTPIQKKKLLTESPFFQDSWSKTILDKSVEYCARAGIREEDLIRSLKGRVSRPLTEYLTQIRFRMQTSPGIVITDADIKSRDVIPLIVGFFVRNAIDARLMRVNTIIDGIKEDVDLSGEIILISDFYETPSTSERAEQFVYKQLTEFLYDRRARSSHTIVFLAKDASATLKHYPNLNQLFSEYG